MIITRMNNLVHGESDLVSVLITSILDQKKLALVKKKIESPELPAPEFPCLINSLRPVLVTKLQGYNRKVKKNYINDSLSE